MSLDNHLAELAGLGYWQYWPALDEFAWSGLCCELHGERPDSPANYQTLLNCYPEEARNRVRAAVANARENSTFTLLVTVRHSGRKLRLTGKLLSDGSFLVVVKPELHTLETEPDNDRGLSNRQRRVEELMFRSAPDLLFVKDSEFRIVQANPAFLNVYPAEMRDKVIGYTTFEAYPPEQMKAFVAEDQRALDEGYSEVQETVDMPDGQTRTLLTRKMAFADHDGQRYIFGMARDITDLKNTEASLTEANRELKEFAYRVSHDLRSPLVSSIKLLSLALKAMDQQSFAESRILVDTAHGSLLNLEKLARDILDLQRLNHADSINERFQLEEVIMDVWQRQPEHKAQLVTHIDSEPVICDRAGLKMVLVNLISNAITYQDQTKPEHLVEIVASSTPDTIHISIRDYGIGFPEAQRDKIFEMFQRFHPKLSVGTGLGLYMVKKWLDRVGGDIKLEHLTDGSQFSVNLPQGSLTES
ncbi:MAG: sensor histidine kinase [Pseudomonadales bacterium]